MPKLPTARQTQPVKKSARNPDADRQSLARAFLTFTQAASSLEKSYTQLQGEVGRLRADLEYANAELSRSLEETSRVRAFLGRILEGLPCGVLVTDEQGKPRLLNPEGQRLLALEPQWRLGEDGRCVEVIADLLRSVIPEEATAEREWIPSQIQETTIGVSATRVESATEGPSETIWILRDISDQKRLMAEREAARRAHALAEIATVLAHEIRNPLASMELFAGLLAGVTEGMPEADQWVVHLQAGLRSLSATVNNVLQFHTQSRGELLPIDLDRLLRETGEFLGPLARQRGLSISVTNLAECANVAGDSHRLQQVFFNLALNAFQAMDEGGMLRISLRADAAVPGELQIDFEDQGRGIEGPVLETIFEPGYTTKAGSPGLGLSVCKKTIEQHGGRIEAKSVPLHKTKFSIYLPLLKGRACR
jgi:two-component system sensor histidine kinase FlrB